MTNKHQNHWNRPVAWSLFGLLLLLLASGSWAAAPTHAQGTSNCDGGEGVYLYEQANYQGRCSKFTDNVADLSGWFVGNDAASSVRIVGVWVATLYESGNYQGTDSTFSQSDPDLADDLIGARRASSVRVRGGAEGATCSPIGQYCAEYYRTRDLSGGPAFTRAETTLDHDWGVDGPGFGLPADGFSARWQGRFAFAASPYTFIAQADDGIRVWIDNNLIIDQWRDQPLTEYRALQNVMAGEHEIRVEYYENVAGAVARLRWVVGGCPVGQYTAEYYNNRDLSGSPTFMRCEAAINNNYGAGGPGNGVGNDNFSVRWRGRFNFNADSYAFIARADDGMRVWIDGVAIIDEWRIQPLQEYRATRSISAGEHEIRVEYFEQGLDATASLRWEAGCPAGQYRAEYFANRDLSGAPAIIRCETAINNNWGTGSPLPGLPADNFSVRWTGRFNFNAIPYTFIATTDDGMRVSLDNTLIIDQWRDQGQMEYRTTQNLTAGEHQIKVEYYEAVAGAIASLRWEAGACPVGQFRADYFPNQTLTVPPLVSRCEATINNDWGTGSPLPGLPVDGFAVRWTGRFAFNPGGYTFIARTDDGMRAYVDNALILDKWFAQGSTEYRVPRDVTAGEHEIKVEYFDGTGGAVAQFRWEFAACPVGQFRAEYFPNQTLSGSPTFVRCEAAINNNYGAGGPGNGIGNDNFSVRWTGRFNFDANTYTFIARTDDGMRVWVDGAPLLDEWRVQAVQEYRPTRTLSAGEHEVKVEYFEADRDATAILRWEGSGCPVNQFRAEYYSNTTLSGTPVFTRCEAGINYNYGLNGPGNGIGNDNFSVRWTGRFNFVGGNYTFIARTDDGMRVWVDDAIILDEWRIQSARDYRVPRAVGAGEHEVRVEYFEGNQQAVAILRWERN